MGALVLGFLPSLFRGFRLTYWWTSSSFREIEKFVDSASSFGTQAMKHYSISESRNILLPFFHDDQIENPQIGIHNATPYKFALSPVLLGL